MTARLHVLVGSGGVGKTTLAAGYALALAARGHRVGLLGIDPSRRLAGALGVALSDLEAPIACAGQLRAAIVQPHQAITRWVSETSADPQIARRLDANPFFTALGDRLATATDLLAAARIAEWAERDPTLTDLVVDTAPGLAMLDFVRAPRMLGALVEGWPLRALRALVRSGGEPGESGRTGGWFGARRASAALASAFTGLAGARTVGQLAEFFSLMRAPLERMLDRVERARRWLGSGAAELLLVTSSRDTGAAGAAQLRTALAAEGLAPHAVIVNRTWPAELAAELGAARVPVGGERLVGYLQAQLAAQAGVFAAIAGWAPVVAVGAHPGLGELDTLEQLQWLGEALRSGLDPTAEVVTRRMS